MFDGAINGERFRGFIEQMLAPSLREGDIVQSEQPRPPAASKRFAAQGAQLVCLPPHSPDLNPIEQAFTKFKPALRQVAE